MINHLLLFLHRRKPSTDRVNKCVKITHVGNERSWIQFHAVWQKNWSFHWYSIKVKSLIWVTLRKMYQIICLGNIEDTIQVFSLHVMLDKLHWRIFVVKELSFEKEKCSPKCLAWGLLKTRHLVMSSSSVWDWTVKNLSFKLKHWLQGSS